MEEEKGGANGQSVSTRSKRITKDNKATPVQRGGSGRKAAAGDDDEDSQVSSCIKQRINSFHLSASSQRVAITYHKTKRKKAIADKTK